MKKGRLLARLIFEEALRRTLLGLEEKVRASALCSIMVSLHGIEYQSLPVLRDAGAHATFTESNVKMIAAKNWGRGEAAGSGYALL